MSRDQIQDTHQDIGQNQDQSQIITHVPIETDESKGDIESNHYKKDKLNFNKDALPFIPRRLSSPNTDTENDWRSNEWRSNDWRSHQNQPGPFMTNPPFVTPITSDSNSPKSSAKFLLGISDLPNINESQLEDLIGELGDDIDFSIVNFKEGNCVVELNDYQQSIDLTESLNGYEWMDHCLQVQLIPMVYYLSPSNVQIPPYYPSYRYQPYAQFQGYPPAFGYGQYYPFQGPPANYPPMIPHSGSRSSSASSASSNSTPNSSTSGVPPFLMNFVTSKYDEANADFIMVETEDGQSIKVNACRLFVGNVPFTSTWSSLKEFLITKCKEFEPENDIQILSVEIPVNSNTSFKENFPDGKPHITSRGFAIITTGNKSSSDKLIKYFDGIEFEGRALTVRYDKFPEFNNYVLQQLYPNQLNKEKTLASLGFERNSFHQKFYYGNRPYSNHQQPHHKYHNHVYKSQLNQPYSPRRHSSPRLPVLQPNFIPPIHPSAHYTNNLNIPSIKNKDNTKPNDNVNEDEKARELVNSFKSLGISS